MILSRSRRDLSEALTSIRESRLRLGFVPTMGYLHKGHLSLVELARERSDFLAVSIFVNPLQFAPGEDLGQYPRDLDRDLGLLQDRGVDLVFSPSAEEMYPNGDPQVVVDPGPMGRILCGEHRPHHFSGVLTVVARLFGLVRPQVAVFGQKDYQQAVLIRRMVRDLEMGVEVTLGPIVREEDGLALSSRNISLTEEERAEATGLSQSLQEVQKEFSGGTSSGTDLTEVLASVVEGHRLLRLQYGAIVHPESLERVEAVFPGAVVAVAAHCGDTRLIDNHILEG